MHKNGLCHSMILTYKEDSVNVVKMVYGVILYGQPFMPVGFVNLIYQISDSNIPVSQ